MFYDLHIHSALSPCANKDMTPSNIAGFLTLSGAEVISVADHNSARNLPAVKKICDHYGIRLLPAIEANTAEEIHLLCYFRTVEDALAMGEEIYKTIPDFPVDTSIWGEQLVMDEEDHVVETVPRLLTLASGYDIYEMKKMVDQLGGIAVPAHVDKDSYSLLAVMGFLPEDLPFEAIELAKPHKYFEEYQKDGKLPEGLFTLTSSDAHALEQLVREPLPKLEENHPLRRLIK